ncbi:MAG: hypothetical protein JXR16_08215 [Bermanella sp.]
MLLRSIFLLLFSSQAFSAGITIDVDLNMTIDAIKYIDQESDDTNLYAYLDIIEQCPEPSTTQADAETNNADLNAFLSESGFTLATEKTTFDGSNLDNFQFHQDGTWTAYDDINRKLVRNWDEGCPHAPRSIKFDTNYENVHTVGISKELGMAYFNSDTDGDIFDLAEESENNLAWLDEKPEGEIKDLFWLDDILFAHIVGGINTGVWQVKPQWQKRMNTSLTATADILDTEAGLMGVSKESSLKVQWLEQSKGHTYTFHASGVKGYQVYPFNNGTVLAAQSQNAWKFQWIKFGEKEQVVTFSKPVNDLIACENTDDYLFCFDRRESGEIFIWRMMIPLFGFPVFVLDSKFTADLISEDADIIAIQISDSHRLITIIDEEKVGLVKVSSTGSAYRLINESAIFSKLSSTKQAHVYLTESELNLLTVNQQAVSPFLPYLVSQSEVFKEIEEIEGEKEVEVKPEEPVEEELEEREETSDEEPRPRAEISGAFSPYYLFALMLLLITGRRKTTL